MTYSIIGYDLNSGEIGVILQSYYYGCGPRTIAASPGKGIVVMQMVPDAAYGDQGMTAMADGHTPESVLDRLVDRDPGSAMRQVAMMNCRGDMAAFTGKECIPASGHRAGARCCAQGSMVLSERVWHAMVDSFESDTGPLPERLLRAMRAGEQNGGDIRGRRAAAMRIVSGTEETSWVRSRPIDIRVDDSANPLAEVERHLALQRQMGAIELAFERGLSGDLAGSIDDYARLAESWPENPDLTMRYAIILAKDGDIAGARRQLLSMVKIHSGWSHVPKRLAKSGLLPDSPELLDGLHVQ